ncbi:DAHL domain-containing protein, partial [Rhodoferax sp.]|uniref:DAHL domain-containing protein n=1 Tax=Rhodoferax sp. TaxID=50421 RepID=UPI0026257F59
MSWGRVSAKYGLWLLAFVLLGWLYRQSTQIDIDLHVRKVAYLEQLRQQDARLNQYVLQSRYGLLLNYDPLVASQQDIAHLLASLQTISPTLFGAGNSPLQQAFANYQNQFKD